jgi:hypothetical protein
MSYYMASRARQATPTFTPVQAGLLQRKAGCT